MLFALSALANSRCLFINSKWVSFDLNLVLNAQKGLVSVSILCASVAALVNGVIGGEKRKEQRQPLLQLRCEKGLIAGLSDM